MVNIPLEEKYVKDAMYVYGKNQLQHALDHLKGVLTNLPINKKEISTVKYYIERAEVAFDIEKDL